jgi:hypothetical protein
LETEEWEKVLMPKITTLPARAVMMTEDKIVGVGQDTKRGAEGMKVEA